MSCLIAQCRNAERHSAECRYAECRYAECRGAFQLFKFSIDLMVRTQVQVGYLLISQFNNNMSVVPGPML
jgi:hypothetical protein